MAQLKLKERKAQERVREERIRRALVDRKKLLAGDKREKRLKRKTAGELLCQVNICGIEDRILRSADTYVSRSYNLDRQIEGLLSHLFVRYSVPRFLYQCCVKATDDPFKSMHETYRMWFVTLAQGGSFRKLVKGVMTAREASVFLSASASRHIHVNVWWAKMRVAGLPEAVAEKLIDRILGHHFFDDPQGRMAELIRFYSNYHQEMDRTTFSEVTDYLTWKLANDAAFSLKGRTAASVVMLTNEWHLLMQKARLNHAVAWDGMGLPDWEYEARDRIWAVTELRNNRELINEGRKQKHCVYSYVQACEAGRSAIFSLRAYRKIPEYTADGQRIWNRAFELTRITAEVNPQRVVVQVRGHLNRSATEDETLVLRRWTGEMGLRIRS